MSDEIEKVDIVDNEDLDQLNELDAILAEATQVDGGVIGEDGAMVEQDDSEQIETSELLYPIISAGFDIFASKWKVPDKHKQALAQAYGDLLDKYFPDAGSMFGVELTALTVTGMVIAPHMLGSSNEKDVTPKEKPKPKPEEVPSVKPTFDHKPTYQETEGFKLD